MTTMSQLSEEDANLASQCLDICQTLAGKSLPFSFNIGPNFSFSVDTRGKEVLAPQKKKKTPSTLRRDARRREELLRKKLSVPTSENTFKCDHCHHLSSILLLSLLLFISSLFFNLDKCDHRNSVVFSLQVEGCRKASSLFQLRQELLQQSVWNPDSGSV